MIDAGLTRRTLRWGSGAGRDSERATVLRPFRDELAVGNFLDDRDVRDPCTERAADVGFSLLAELSDSVADWQIADSNQPLEWPIKFQNHE